jgi:hypothetical protein
MGLSKQSLVNIIRQQQTKSQQPDTRVEEAIWDAYVSATRVDNESPETRIDILWEMLGMWKYDLCQREQNSYRGLQDGRIISTYRATLLDIKYFEELFDCKIDINRINNSDEGLELREYAKELLPYVATYSILKFGDAEEFPGAFLEHTFMPSLSTFRISQH